MKPRPMMLLAAALLLPSTPGAGAEPSVFYAPAERPRVTAERAALLAASTLRDSTGGQLAQPLKSDVFIAGAAASGSAGTRAAVSERRLEGISQARGGNAHAWIGGSRYEDGSLFHGQRLRVRHDGVLLLGPAGATRRFRVGESIPEGSSPPADLSP